jgi:hypothetical protein
MYILPHALTPAFPPQIYTEAPKNLPDVEAVMGSDALNLLQRPAGNRGGVIIGAGRGGNAARGGGANAGGGGDGWRMAQNKGQQMQQQQQQQQQGRGRDQGRGGGRGGGRRGQRDEPLDIEIKALTKSENRYVKKEDVEGDEKTLRTMNGILNKLTPEKFDTLILKVLELEIDTVNLLRKVQYSPHLPSLCSPHPLTPCSCLTRSPPHVPPCSRSCLLRW